MLEARSDDTHWTIRVRDGGVETQVISVETDLPERRPWLGDADGDRAADLWIPLIGDNASTAWDLWVMQPDAARFRRAGEVNGIGLLARPGGQAGGVGARGCCTVSMLFHRVDADGRLREAFAVNRRLDEYGPQRCTGTAITEPAPARRCARHLCAGGGGMPGVRLGPP